MTYRSRVDNYNFPLTASIKSQCLRFLRVKGVKFHLFNPKRHYLG